MVTAICCERLSQPNRCFARALRALQRSIMNVSLFLQSCSRSRAMQRLFLARSSSAPRGVVSGFPAQGKYSILHVHGALRQLNTRRVLT